MKNGIIIPCYNEANRLKFEEFQEFIETNPNYVLCFVNDGSQDETYNQLQNFQAQNSKAQVIIVNLEQNAGKAEAVRQGAQRLLSEDVDTIGFLDADLATGFEDYTRLVQILRVGRKSMVFGSRKLNTETEIERSSFRKAASAIVGRFINLIIGMPVKDTQCGAKVFNRSTAGYIFHASFLSRWLFDVEIFVRMKRLMGHTVMDKVSEVGLMSWEEVEGSKITLKDSIRFPLQLLEIGMAYNIRPQLGRLVGTYGLRIPGRAA